MEHVALYILGGCLLLTSLAIGWLLVTGRWHVTLFDSFASSDISAFGNQQTATGSKHGYLTELDWPETISTFNESDSGGTTSKAQQEQPKIATFDVELVQRDDESGLLSAVNILLSRNMVLQLDTGSANALVSSTFGLTKLLDKNNSSICQTFYYGNSGQSTTCPGTMPIGKSRRPINVQVVMNTSSTDPNIEAPTNILGIAPGTKKNHTAIVRQFDLVSYRLMLHQQLFTVVPRNTLLPLKPRDSFCQFALHPRQLMTLCTVPYMVIFAWNKQPTNTVWRQYMIGENDMITRDEATKQPGPHLLVGLDIGTTVGISSMEVGPSPQVDPNNDICKSITLVYPRRTLQLSPSDAQVLLDSVLYGGAMLQKSPNVSDEEWARIMGSAMRQLFVSFKTQSEADAAFSTSSSSSLSFSNDPSLCSVTFKLSAMDQQEKNMSIPMFAANRPSGNILEFMIGLDAIQTACSGFEVTFEPSTKIPLGWSFYA